LSESWRCVPVELPRRLCFWLGGDLSRGRPNVLGTACFERLVPKPSRCDLSSDVFLKSWGLLSIELPRRLCFWLGGDLCRGRPNVLGTACFERLGPKPSRCALSSGISLKSWRCMPVELPRHFGGLTWWGFDAEVDESLFRQNTLREWMLDLLDALYPTVYCPSHGDVCPSSCHVICVFDLVEIWAEVDKSVLDGALWGSEF